MRGEREDDGFATGVVVVILIVVIGVALFGSGYWLAARHYNRSLDKIRAWYLADLNKTPMRVLMPEDLDVDDQIRLATAILNSALQVQGSVVDVTVTPPEIVRGVEKVEAAAKGMVE